MLSFSRKTDYALIALAHLAGSVGVASAREIAQTYRLSVSLVMKILKRLQHKGIVKSVRGAAGGYQLGLDLHSISLYDLIETLKHMESPESARLFKESAEASLPTEPPLLAVHSKLMRFLKDVKLSDLVLPGRRIDVPVEMVGRKRFEKANPNGFEKANPNSDVAPLVATS
jgi:Rrf2 family transcriptional regulator, cysteine metabolism repressor